MSGIEIERKFLVDKTVNYKALAFQSLRIKQGYLPCDNATVRIRTCNDKAFLTIKSKSADGGLSRYEFEKEILMDEALQLMKLCVGGFIDKTRYKVAHGNHIIEIDEFYGDNEGLVMAEIELQSATELFEKPTFLGPEVTGNQHFYNKYMLACPYREWKEMLPECYR